MIFINPKTDFGFKKIFGSEGSKDLLISFLNALLYNGEDIVLNLTILNPYQAPHIRGVKDTYLDIKAKIPGNKTVIIEMQVLNVQGFEKRILYNAAKAYSIQLDSGQAYHSLAPVIALTITDLEMFPEIPKPIFHFVLKEKEYLLDYNCNDLELVFVELPKFEKKIEELETLADQWIYFLKSAIFLKEVPERIRMVSEIQRAFEVAARANLSRDELDELQHQEFYIQDQQNAILKGYNQGYDRGYGKGIDRGIEQGEKAAAIEIAKKLIGMLYEEAIARTTGLSVEEIRELSNE